METNEALTTLRGVEELRRRTRATANTSWYPVALFGALTLLSTPLCAFAPPWSLGIYWPIAAIAGMAAVARHYTSREARVGVVSYGWRYVAVGVGILIGASLAGALGGSFQSEQLGEVGPYVVVSVGYLAFAALKRSAGLAALAALFLGASLGVAAVGAQHACTVLALLFGAASLAAAAAFRALDPAPR